MPVNASRKRKWLVSIAIQILFVGSGLGLVHYLKQVSPNRDDAKLEEIKSEVAKIPIYPSFQNAGADYSSRYMDASASLYYRSNTSLGNVRTFYDRELPKLGWEIKEVGDSFYYQKNDLRLTIEYRPDQSDWNFAIGIDWKNSENY